MPQLQKITTNLWFDDQAEEAAAFYCGIFENSKVITVTRYTAAGPGTPGSVMTVEFELDGVRLIAINGGPLFTFSEAVSLQINCVGQDEVDHFWERLTDGGSESQCGWCKDRYGLSWQVVPEGMDEIFSDPDPTKAERSMKAMFGMKKLDLAALRAAADGAPAA